MAFALSTDVSAGRHEAIGLLELDADGRVFDANLTAQAWFGIDFTELMGRHSDWLLRQPDESDASAHGIPDLYFLRAADGTELPVLVACDSSNADGHRFVLMFDASKQVEHTEQVQHGHVLASRTQQRLELVIGASVAFADASDERQIAQILRETVMKSYVAEEAAIFLRTETGFKLAAGHNSLENFDSTTDYLHKATELHTALKVSGLNAAYLTTPELGAAFENSGVQSLIVAPIRLRDEVLGVIAIFFHHPRTFDEQATPLADALAGQAARAISGLRLQSRLSHAALHDETTGLPNRRVLENTFDNVGSASEELVAVLFVDLDGFKAVNDQLGHAAGDEILRVVARRLLAGVRDGDLVARYGGDEFVIVCHVSDPLAARDLAERIRSAISAPYPTLPTTMQIGGSVGIAITDTARASTELDGLVREADQAMYRAKSSGGNRVAEASPTL